MTKLASVLSLLLLAACSASTPAPASSPTATNAAKTSAEPKSVTVDALAQKIEKKEAIAVFDANTKDRYAAGHIPGAKWVDATKLDPSALPQDHTSSLVFYCASTQCKASHRAASQASSLGYSDVSVLPEGIVGWEKAGKPVEK